LRACLPGCEAGHGAAEIRSGISLAVHGGVLDHPPSGALTPSVGGVAIPADARPGLSPEPFTPDFEPPSDWRRPLGAVLRYRSWILVSMALGVLGGAIAARVQSRRYLAQATVWIQSSDQRTTARGPIGSDQFLQAAAWVDLLRSYIVLDDVVRQLRLCLRYEARDARAFSTFALSDEFQPGDYRLVVDGTERTFRLEARGGAELQHGAVGDSIGQALGFRWVPSAEVLAPGSDLRFTVASLRDAAKHLGDGLNVTIDPSGNFLRIALVGGEGSAAARVVNTVAQRYVAAAAELKRSKLTELAGLLDQQLQAARGNLQRVETALEEFRRRTITLLPDPGTSSGLAAPQGGSAALRDFFSLKVELDQERRDRQAIAQWLAVVPDSGAAIDGLASIGAVQRFPDLRIALEELTTKRAELRALRYRYTDDHPQVRRRTAELGVLERQTIPALAQALLTDLATRERTLVGDVSAGGRELQAIPERAVEEARLRRDVTIAENLYTGVQQRYEEARLAEGSTVADVRILDRAVATLEPMRAAATRFIALGLIAGLGLGVLAAVVADRRDPRVQYPDQVTRQIGLPILGVLPHVGDRQAGVEDEQVAHAIEAMRSVRLSLTHAYAAAGAGPLVVTVSSPGIGDGKSFVTANLALAFADAGRRTVLLDGDVRRGALHRAVQAKRRPGLTDFLAGRAPCEAVLQRTAYPDLDFIGAGTRFRDSPELLGSLPMQELLAHLRRSYNVILVDSPPLGSGVDPYTLGTLTGSMLLVVRTGTTNLDLARTKLAMLDSLPIRLLGVVVNDVRPGGVYRYYSYLSGYAAEDEGAAVATRRHGML
jgi:capsular exopolysaccharide synthesis family protein